MNNDAILEENKLLIDMSVYSACNACISDQLQNYLLLSLSEGWHDLVAAVKLVVAGERNIEVFSNLDEEDTIVISRILELLNDPDIIVNNLLIKAQQSLDKSPEEAHIIIDSALKICPNNPIVHALKGQAYHRQRLLDKASSAYRKSLLIAPDQPRVLLNLGVIMNDLKQFNEAIAVFEQVLDVQPDNIEAIAHLGYLYERAYNLDEAQGLVERGLGLDPENPILKFIDGKLMQRADKSHGAIQQIKKAIAADLPVNLLGEAYSRLGYLYDGIDEIDHAIESFTKKNQIYARQCQMAGVKDHAFINEVEYVRDVGEKNICDSAGFLDKNADPVFLIGFPRSGTTLLNQILDSHSQIQTLEEKPLVANMLHKMQQMLKGNDALSGSEINVLRKVYFSSVAQYADIKPENIFIDKFPLNIAYVPILAKVFPTAKYILALRHPCDVCLSCFMHSFGINTAMCHFKSIEDTISLYLKLMSGWEEFSKANNIKYHRIRYEDTIGDFRNETMNLLDYLGLAWDKEIESHTEKARSGGVIDTPSYDQVTKPLYTSAIYRWKRYEAMFKPYLNSLEYLCNEYGYH